MNQCHDANSKLTHAHQKTLPFTTSHDPLLKKCLHKLEEMGFFTSFDSCMFDGTKNVAAATPLTLRAEIPYQPWLLERIIRLDGLLNKKAVVRVSSSPCKYSFRHQVSIYSAMENAKEAIHNGINKETNAPRELMFQVMWALKETLPAAYEKLLLPPTVKSKLICAPTKMVKQLAPVPYNDTEPAFVFSEGDFMEKTSIHPSELVNTFITGTTGAGKTFGGVIPLLKSFLSYKNSKNQSMSMLVIDPKFELQQVCESELAKLGEQDRLLSVGNGQRLSYFSDDCTLGLTDRYRHMAEMACTKGVGEANVWQEKAHRMNLAFLRHDRNFYLATGVSQLGIVHSLIAAEDKLNESVWVNLMEIYRFSLSSSAHVRWVHQLLTIVMGLFTDCVSIESELKMYAQDKAEMLEQFFYRANLGEEICTNLSQPEITECINTDLYPSDANDLQVDDLILQGKVLLLQPSNEHTGDFVGRLIKARYFSDIFQRSDMLIPIGYVADEFQRFITSDRNTGEQSFLDRCRAYRVNCVLATQSIAALQHALSSSDRKVAELSTQIIVANSPTKLVFRSTDDITSQQLRNWLPLAPSDHKHVVDVRPISSLKTGFAYYMLNGDWGYCKYHHLPKPVAAASYSAH